MLRRALRPTLAVLVSTAMLVGVTATQQGAQADPTYGPPYEFYTELMGDGAGLDGDGVIPLKNQAMITRTTHGYLYRSGQQDGHLVVTTVTGGLRFADTGTSKFKSLASTCKPRRVRIGVAAVCTMPAGVSVSQPLLLEVWPRAGDDVTDGSTLPASIAMAVLADAGNDVTRVGAGPDFVNSAQDRDRAFGGAGNDWLRGGADDDAIHGGAGADYLVGTDGRDTLFGGAGDDKLTGGDFDDMLYTGSGQDVAQCGAGTDYAKVDVSDKELDCETVDRS